MNIKKIPLRTCALTREKLEKNKLFRIVRTPDGNVMVDDERGKTNGRGTYLKKDKEIILKAKNKKVLDRHLECSIGDSIYDELINRL